MGFLHHGTIKKYTAMLLDAFNDLEVQYKDSNGVIHSKNIPICFSSAEKAKKLDDYTVEQIVSGNYNVLPRASLSWDAMMKSDQRNTNKNIKINKVKNEDNYEFQYNSVSYDFVYELTIQCRGMNEATMIIEQIAPKFNPTLNIDVYDGINLNEPTRVPIKLMDFAIEHEEYEEFSSNIVTVSASLNVSGNLYPPIKTIDRIKDFKIQLNEQQGDYYSKRTIMGWDVDENGLLQNEEIIIPNNNVPYIIDIISLDLLKIGENNLKVIYEDKDSLIYELSFEWDVLSGDAVIEFEKEKAVLTVNSSSDVEVQVNIKDSSNNYASLSKVFRF